ncbi:hypothetical protein ElyMa_000196600 [Elysia marginata]|uniref:Uncharacterized protein n=1 Tax=Elysia marginata TaxID=1093978 RepID=A0AAV4EVB0_9GAST|nr:hypothetical protein ElyMa_000196600 [Elysia marginata]
MSLRASIPISSLALLLAIAGAGAITRCVYNEAACGCDTDKGLISLKKYENSPLISREHFIYSDNVYWNPCKEMTIKTTTASCIQIFNGIVIDCGVHDTMRSSVEGDHAVFRLDPAGRSEWPHSDTKSEFHCICKPNAEDEFVRDYRLVLDYLVLNITGDSCCPK